MVTEMSANTYDWERAEHQARGMISAARDITYACKNAPNIPLDSAPNPEDILDPEKSGGWSDWQSTWRDIVDAHETHLGGLPMEVSASYLDDEQSSDPGVHLTAKSGSDASHIRFTTRYQPSGTVWVSALRMNLWGQGGMVYVFDKAEVDSLTEARWEQYFDEMSYYFRYKREAELLAEDTLFSEREAEVLILQRAGWSSKHISRIAEISESTISTYRSRWSDKEQKAHRAIETARRTLDVLADADDLPTEACTKVPESVGRAIYNPEDEHTTECADLEVVANFVWMPSDFDSMNLVRGVPVATFARVGDEAGSDGAILVVDDPSGADYYVLDGDDLDEEIETFRDKTGEDGSWRDVNELDANVSA